MKASSCKLQGGGLVKSAEQLKYGGGVDTRCNPVCTTSF